MTCFDVLRLPARIWRLLVHRLYPQTIVRRWVLTQCTTGPRAPTSVLRGCPRPHQCITGHIAPLSVLRVSRPRVSPLFLTPTFFLSFGHVFVLMWLAVCCRACLSCCACLFSCWAAPTPPVSTYYMYPCTTCILRVHHCAVLSLGCDRPARIALANFVFPIKLL